MNRKEDPSQLLFDFAKPIAKPISMLWSENLIFYNLPVTYYITTTTITGNNTNLYNTTTIG